MSNPILTPILELKLTELTPVFEAHQLEEKATSLLQDLRTLLDTKTLLQHTALTHTFRLVVDDRQEPGVLLVIGLALSNQHVLDFQYETRSLGAMEQLILEDRKKVVNACRNLPTQSALVAIEFSQRISAACLNLPVEDIQPELSKRLKVLLGVKRRNWHGVLTDHPWQHQLPAIAKYEWRSELLSVRVQLQRERRGFSLRLMRPDSLPTLIRSVQKLRMPERPADIDKASILDRAEYTRSPIDMVIRAGSRPGSDQLIVADFVGFKLADQAKVLPPN
ncbi:hypothetical protein [Polaromonas jejuensis]|uniref:Uncharacterized protein n=1 Tax=Polaromonas jejuensis TaxID=457502 RepID=A0ABW0Q9I3_9BURK|nr:hypothetical protein [Polaromonas jejuensis]